MRVPGRGLLVALTCLSNIGLLIPCLSSLATAQPDQVIAEQVLGPQWRQLSRRAGMIFAGTVLAAPSTETTQTAATVEAIRGTTPPAIPLTFRVDKAIAGVEPGQVLTIHEWAGARYMQRPMIKGQHVLIFLYPPSRLGLTSPVGGSRGQIVLDPSGKTVVGPAPSAPTRVSVPTGSVSVLQLKRAILSAREE